MKRHGMWTAAPVQTSRTTRRTSPSLSEQKTKFRRSPKARPAARPVFHAQSHRGGRLLPSAPDVDISGLVGTLPISSS